MISKFHCLKIFCFLNIFLYTDIILVHDYFDLNMDVFSFVFSNKGHHHDIINYQCIIVKFTILLGTLLFMYFSIALWLLYGEKLL